MSKHYLKIFLVAFLFWGNFALAQKSTNSNKATIIKENIQNMPSVERVSYSDETGFPQAILFNINGEGQPEATEAREVIKRIFSLSSNTSLASKNNRISVKDAQIDRYQMVLNGIKVEHGQYTVLSKNNKIVSIQAEFYDLDELSSSPSISEAQALQNALARVGAETYVWEQLDILINSGQFSPAQNQMFQKAKMQFYPKGDLVYVKDYYASGNQLQLAYKFTIEAHQPLSRDDVYVNAHSGSILLLNPHIKHGTGETRYAGERTFPTTDLGGNVFELAGVDPTSGIFLDTRSLEGIGGLPLSVAAIYSLSVPIQDGDETADPCILDDPPIGETGDDVWGTGGNGEHRPASFDPANLCCPTYGAYDPLNFSCNEVENSDIALDAHWGASIVAQYWNQIHNRNSFDDGGADILSFVHYGDAYDNAFWNGAFMTYGDGSYQGGSPTSPGTGGGFAPLSSLDVCAHEIGHAICTFTSDLVYQRESGAMNEGFSDIWAACAEYFVLNTIDATLPFDPWGVGEQIDENDGGLPPGTAASTALRWMDDPHAESNPDTYGLNDAEWSEPECGEPNLANDQCGVHNNSGVLNKWFYLLVSGSGLPFSPGAGKAAADDSMNENGDTYSVTGLGFGEAELITFLGEILLNPNSKFADMRDASITAARILYGPCSQQEESTTNAWHAVGVGTAFQPCVEQILFSETNPVAFSERNIGINCGDSEDFTIGVYSSVLMSPQTINITTSGTATLNEDYALAMTTLDFSGSQIHQILLTIFNDKVVEGTETVVLSFDNGTYMDTYSFDITDNDIVPVVGSSSQTLLTEGFEISETPTGWTQQFINPESGNQWYFNGVGEAAGRAYVSLADGTPVYDQTVDATIMIVTPRISALGKSNINVSFDYKAGGEQDAVEPILFDYGTFRYSFDGLSWTDVEDYVGTSGGNVPIEGTFNMAMPILDNTEFLLGWRWHNDALVGSGFSFSIDNVLVTGDPAQVETIAGNSASANIGPNQQVYFISDQTSDLIARVRSLGGDLGCVDVFVNDNGADMVAAPAGHNRSGKVFEVTSTSSGMDYELTLYFRDTEVDDWPSPASLNMMKVEGSNIDDIDAATTILENSDLTVDDQIAGSGFISYQGTFNGFSTFALTDRGPVDLLPNFTFGSLVYNAGEIKPIICNINEISNNSTLGQNQFFVPFVAGFSITFDPAQTTSLISGVTQTVNNTDWDLTIMPGVGLLFSTKPGISIPAGLRSRVALMVEAVTPGAVGSITSNITDGSGGDSNAQNNSAILGISIQRQL